MHLPLSSGQISLLEKFSILHIHCKGHNKYRMIMIYSECGLMFKLTHGIGCGHVGSVLQAPSDVLQQPNDYTLGLLLLLQNRISHLDIHYISLLVTDRDIYVVLLLTSSNLSINEVMSWSRFTNSSYLAASALSSYIIIQRR